MMYLIINLCLGLLFSGPNFSADVGVGPLEESTFAPPRELCKLSGSVYVTDDPKRAHYYVYVEEYESSADLSVFVEENKLFADQPGHWYYTDKEAFADFVVYFTDNIGMADFKIFYTDVSSFAGCRK